MESCPHLVTDHMHAACEPLEARRLLAAEVISVAAAGGSTGNGVSAEDQDLQGGAPTASTVSDNGRYVAFVSTATDLLPGETTGGRNIFVRDRATGTTRLASVRTDGRYSSGAAAPSISGDGRYVAFSSDEGFVVPNVPGAGLFVRDLQAGTTSLVSRTPAGAGANGVSHTPVITRNGRYIAFYSKGTDIVPGVPQTPDGAVFRYDVQTGIVEPVTDDVAAADSNAILTGIHQISDDGNVVAFGVSSAVGGSAGSDIYVKNMTTGQTTLATVSAAGAAVGEVVDNFELSGDGRTVVFETTAAATPDDINFTEDVFARDLAAGSTTLLSVTEAGTSRAPGTSFGSHLSFLRSVSTDGRFVVLESADELSGAPESDGGTPFYNVFVRDRVAGATRRLSVDPPGVREQAFLATISADGRFAAFYTDLNPELFTLPLVVVDLVGGGRIIANEKPGGGIYEQDGGSISLGGVFSRNGNVIVFAGQGDASALVPGITDNNLGGDLFAVTLPGAPALDGQAPVATLGALAAVTTPGATSYEFDVTYIDDNVVDAATIGDGDVVVTGPNGFRRPATLLSATPIAGGSQLAARYQVIAPGGAFDAAANGTYALEIAANEVKDAAGNPVAAGPVAGGMFSVDVPLGTGPDLQAVSLTGALPASVVGGEKQKIKPLPFTMTNAGTDLAAGVVTVRLVASTDDVIEPNDPVVAELPNQRLRLAPGKSRVVKFKVRSFALPEGDYRLIAIVDAGGALSERLESNNAAPLAAPLHIDPPTVDIAIASPTLTGRLAKGKRATVLVTARNDGNQMAKGIQPVRVRLSTDPSNPAAVSRTLDGTLKLSLKPGASKPARLKVTLPADLPPGSYFVVVELLTGAPWTDADASDNVATSIAAYPV